VYSHIETDLIAGWMFQSPDSSARQIVEFVRMHEAWAAPLAFALAFGESLAFLSLLVPAWAALIGIGVLIGAGNLDFWPIWIAAALGAALGDWLSYWLGLKIGRPIAKIWPISRHPQLLPSAETFVHRWGVFAVVIGRFFGPLRASVPLAAGIFRMPYWQFQIANFSSAFLWAGVLLTVGDVVTLALEWAWG
jgi:membrane protein DedA with SNARE-associated domain